MTDTPQAAHKMLLYKPGDKLEVFRPKETIGSWHKSWSLLFFKIDQLDFTGVSQLFAVWIKNKFRNDNINYVGDLVTRSREQVKAGSSGFSSNLGEKSMGIVDQILEKMGLCYELNVFEDWPPEIYEGWQLTKLETLSRELPIPALEPGSRGRPAPSVRRYLEKVLRP